MGFLGRSSRVCVFVAPLCAHEHMTTILEPQVFSIEGVAQSSGLRSADLGFSLTDLGFSLNPPHTSCVTLSMSLTFLSLCFLMCKMGVKRDLVRIK